MACRIPGRVLHGDAACRCFGMALDPAEHQSQHPGERLSKCIQTAPEAIKLYHRVTEMDADPSDESLPFPVGAWTAGILKLQTGFFGRQRKGALGRNQGGKQPQGVVEVQVRQEKIELFSPRFGMS